MKRILIESGIAIILLAVIAFLWGLNGQLRNDRERYRRNTETLMSDVEQYRVRDSLNAAKCTGLELKLSEYERFRAEDMALISDLRTKKRDLERITAAQLETITELSTVARDTVIIRDSVAVPAQTLTIRDKWFDFDGMVANGLFTGTVINRDSLIVVESVTMSRCLFKKWRRVKNRSVDIISKNPNTKIQDIEYVIIEK